ncbi:MAG: hypothetical protein M1820_000464 [Bogoriella megaspora]|nr:MAG: hypothetical protein M1820_000464 [Bogoriella megaspora]
MAKFDAILQKWTDARNGSIHGASFVAYDSTGKCLYSGAQGSRTVDRSTNVPATTHDLCWLASQTKLVTAVAAMQMIERGLIGIDDDVGKVVPQLASKEVIAGFEGDETQSGKELNPATLLYDFQNPRKPILRKATKPISLRYLLTHTSGFAYDFTSEELCEYLAFHGVDVGERNSLEKYNTPLIFEPGTKFRYGVGTDWAGHVVERLSGKNLNAYIQENICARLGMKNTTFFPDTEPGRFGPELDLAFRSDGPKGSLVKGSVPPTWRPAKEALGGAGLYSTADDYGLFLKALVSGGGPLLKKETLDLMFTGTVANREDLTGQTRGVFRNFMAQDLLPDTEVDYCPGGLVSLTPVSGRRAEGSIKWGGSSNPLWWIDMRNGVAGTMMTQIQPPADSAANDLFVELEEQVYKSIGKA